MIHFFIILLIHFTVSTAACPGICMCKWKNGKQTVECIDRGALSIPGGMDPGTQVLDFSGNSVDELHPEIFIKLDLVNLQRLFLARSRITTVDNRAFRGLSNLVELDLSGNLLEVIPTEAFADSHSLMRLTLSGNPIKAVERVAFSRLIYLNTLELNDCEIETVEEDAFQGLQSLEWLRLDGNRLKNVKGCGAWPQNLRGVELQGNLWACDCHLQELRNWLETFSISKPAEPRCFGPTKMARRAVKSIRLEELACLPNISPTTLYLEMGEGKNISLLCNVQAVPEAKVTWWFQGQLLQNDSIISPGIRLLYYIEEGTEEKKSELFIYNINAEDNGTFICSAENPAGIVSSNYTIKIVLKEEPVIMSPTLPFEYILAAVSGAGLLLLIVIITIIICVIRCKRNRKRMEKREKTKEVALQYQQNMTKCCEENNIEELGESLKQNINEINQQDIMFYSPPLANDARRTMSPITMANQLRSPISLRFQLEQNPDLINDTESRRRDGDGEDDRDPAVEQINLVQVPISCMRGSRQHHQQQLYSLHSWDAGCSLDSDGYPSDFGLPKIKSVTQSADNFYRTLPYNRAAKRHSAANPITRFSREAEFLSRSGQPAPYEHFCPQDVRYTADGYPARPEAIAAHTLVPSPPEGYKTVTPETGGGGCPASLPCTSTAPTLIWPANVHLVGSSPESHQSKYANRRCVSAQTDTETPASLGVNTTEGEPLTNADQQQDLMTESPDEGYEGEPTAVL